MSEDTGRSTDESFFEDYMGPAHVDRKSFFLTPLSENPLNDIIGAAAMAFTDLLVTSGQDENWNIWISWYNFTAGTERDHPNIHEDYRALLNLRNVTVTNTGLRGLVERKLMQVEDRPRQGMYFRVTESFIRTSLKIGS